MLELAGNPYNVFTVTELSSDTSYDPYATAPWYIQVALWYNKLDWKWKLLAGAVVGFLLWEWV